MQRQRGELVPIGEVIGGLVKAIREPSPQARHYFNQADQVHQLVGAREADVDRGASWATRWRSAPCPAATPATAFNTSDRTDLSRST